MNGDRGSVTRVAYLTYHVGLGGGELLLLNHLAHANREEFDPLVVCTGEGALPARLRVLGVPVFVLPVDRHVAVLGKVWLPAPSAAWRLAKLLRQERAGLVHAYTLETRNYANVVSLITGIPAIHTCQDTWIGPRLNAAQCWVMNHVPARIIAVSETARQSLRTGTRLDPARVAMIHAGVDLARFAGPIDRAAVRAEFGLAADTPLIGFVGRLNVTVKGFDTLAHALALLAQRLPSVRVLVIGGAFLPGDDDGEVQTLIQHYGLGAHIILTGHRDDVPRLLSAVDVGVSASPRECYPLVLMEAAAAGRPVVATRSGGGEEIVVDGLTGILVPVRDPPAMAEALVALLTDRAKAEAMGRAARERAQARFDIRHMVRLIEAEYRKAIGQRSDPAATVRLRGAR